MFIDLEASGLGLGSWPIEVGWCFLTGAADARLIQPAAQWSQEAWDDDAELLHGISRTRLDVEGEPARQIAAHLNSLLAGHQVFSDAPSWDGYWLYRLYDAAKMRQSFELLDYGELFIGAKNDDVERGRKKADSEAPRIHRALEDACHMRSLYVAVHGESEISKTNQGG